MGIAFLESAGTGIAAGALASGDTLVMEEAEPSVTNVADQDEPASASSGGAQGIRDEDEDRLWKRIEAIDNYSPKIFEAIGVSTLPTEDGLRRLMRYPNGRLRARTERWANRFRALRDMVDGISKKVRSLPVYRGLRRSNEWRTPQIS